MEGAFFLLTAAKKLCYNQSDNLITICVAARARNPRC